MKHLLRFVLWVALAAVAVAQPIRPWLNPGISDPRNLTGLAAWYDVSDTSSLLSSTGATITDGGAVALWADKSGNSGVNCYQTNGIVSGNWATVADNVAFSAPSNLDISIDFAPEASSAYYSVCAHKGAAGNRSYAFGPASGGSLNLLLSIDGTNETSITSTDTVTSALARTKARVTWNGTTGDVTFYTRTSEGAAWVQLGDVVASGVTSALFNSTSVFGIGANNGGAGDRYPGRIYSVSVAVEIGGDPVLDIDFSQSPKKLANGDTFVCSTGQTVTLNSSGATGARIAGERDLYQGTAANRPVYLGYSGMKYGWLNGVAGNYFSTPDSAAVDIAGGFSIWATLTCPDWTPSANSVIASKYTTTGDQRSFQFILVTDGRLEIIVSSDGTSSTLTDLVSNASITASAFDTLSVRVDYTASGTARFYTSADGGSSWAELGTIQSGTARSPYVGTAPFIVGAHTSGTASPLSARVGRVVLIDGTYAAGTIVADFNPALYTSGTTFTASTGEVWTLNGGAKIVTSSGLYFDGSNDYLKTAAFSYVKPESVYFVGSQVSWVSGRSLFDGGAQNGGTTYQTGSSPALALYAGAGPVASVSDLPVGTLGIVTSVFNGASSQNRVNRGTIATGNAGTNDFNGFTVGTHGGGLTAGCSNILACEILLRAAADATATQDAFILYGQIKWDIW